jgi:hypothetical protein
MDIDDIINTDDYKTISEENPKLDFIYNELILNQNVRGIKSKVNKIIEIEDSMNSSDIYTNKDNSVYVLYRFNKEMADIITNIKCNYPISILLTNTISLTFLPSTSQFVRKLLQQFPLFEKMFNKPIDIYENTFPITLPILFMTNTDIQFKIHFKNMEEYIYSDINIEYDSYTLNNLALNNLNYLYRKKKYISNQRGMIFEDGVLKYDFDLD